MAKKSKFQKSCLSQDRLAAIVVAELRVALPTIITGMYARKLCAQPRVLRQAAELLCRKLAIHQNLANRADGCLEPEIARPLKRNLIGVARVEQNETYPSDPNNYVSLKFDPKKRRLP